MAQLEIDYYFDVLSQWCYIAERNLRPVLAQFGSQIDFRAKLCPVNGDRPYPNSRAELERAFRRSERITGIATRPWVEDGEPAQTWEANAAVLAAANLGVCFEAARDAITRAALLDGEPLGSRGRSAAFVAKRFDLDLAMLEAMMFGDVVCNQLHRNVVECQEAGLTVKPALLIRSGIGDQVALSGVYTAAVFGQCMTALLEDETAYEQFEARSALEQP